MTTSTHNAPWYRPVDINAPSPVFFVSLFSQSQTPRRTCEFNSTLPPLKMRTFASLVVAASAVGVNGFLAKRTPAGGESSANEAQDFGFMGEGDLPEICGVKTLTSGQEDYLKGLHTSMRHAGKYQRRLRDFMSF